MLLIMKIEVLFDVQNESLSKTTFEFKHTTILFYFDYFTNSSYIYQKIESTEKKYHWIQKLFI